MSMRQLRQASSQGYNVLHLGRSHENLLNQSSAAHHSGNLSSPYHASQGMSTTTDFRKEPLRRYASAHTLPSGGGFAGGLGGSHVQYRTPRHPPTAPVLRISGDFDDMWSRNHGNAASSQHKAVFGRGTFGFDLHVSVLVIIIGNDPLATHAYHPASC